MSNIIPVTYGYARVSKTDGATRNLESQLHILQQYGIREEHIFTDVMTGCSISRPAWKQLMTWVRPRDTIVVACLDRFSRNFDEGVRIQATLTKQQIGIVSIREDINTADDSAAAKLFQRMMLAEGAYQVEPTGERIRAGIDWARAEGRKPGRPPALIPEQVDIDVPDCRLLVTDQYRSAIGQGRVR